MKLLEQLKTQLMLRGRIAQLLSPVMAVAIAFLLCQFPMDYLESLLYDVRIQFKPTSPVSENVVTIAIDPLTLKEMAGEPEAHYHTQLLEEILKAKPRTVIYVYDPTEMSGTLEDLEAFAKAAEKFNAFYYIVDDLPRVGEEKPFLLPEPLNTIPVFPGPRTSDKNIYAKDGVTRRLIFSYEGMPTLHPLIARSYNSRVLPEDYRGIFDFMGSKQAYIDFHPTGTYKPLSFLNVMQGDFNPSDLTDKVVLIGRDTLELSRDYVLTPYSRDVAAMSMLELQANMFDTLIQNRAVAKTPQWLDLLITSLISILTLYVVLSVRPTQGLVLLGTTLIGFVFITWIVLTVSGFWVGMAHPLMATFVCYYFFIPYRLIMENRKSWEYYQRNRLLTQVEELKSNFLRMMSHDLKTPLARIQGMAEVAMKDPLSVKQKAALETIGQSSEELSEFIGSILSLSRIENKEIKLETKSRDINLVLYDLVQKHEFLAKRKNIEIMCEFEPLFSTKIDEDLMRQVFSNLIENAIKYSPENSKILITTEEQDGKIIVQVADQGFGISREELPNVFGKFYRSPEFTNTDVSGSGLGLYLAKYFVELHKGTIEVESEHGQGSTFTVSLPVSVPVQQSPTL